MRIEINNRTAILAPTGLVANRFTVGMFRRKLKKEGVYLTRKQLLLCLKECKRYKKEHPEWNLIEVCSKDGDTVKVKI